MIAGHLGPRLWGMTAQPAQVEPEDETLAEAIARRDGADTSTAAHAAFDRLRARHAWRVAAYLANRLPAAEREDLGQEVWMRVWRQPTSASPGVPFRARLMTIAKNALIDHARRRRPVALGEGIDPPDDRGDGPDSGLLERERADALARCLKGLDERSRVVVRGRLSGEGYDELAPKLGVPTARVHRLFHDAKMRLTACLERALG